MRRSAAYGAFLLADGIGWIVVWFAVLAPSLSSSYPIPEDEPFFLLLLAVGILMVVGGAVLLIRELGERAKPHASTP